MQKYTDPPKIINDCFNGRPLIAFFGVYNPDSLYMYFHKVIFNPIKRQYFPIKLHCIGKTSSRKSQLINEEEYNVINTGNVTRELMYSIRQVQKIIENMEL